MKALEREIAQAHIDSCFAYDLDKEGHPHPCITHEDMVIKEIIRTTKLVPKIANSKGELFKVKVSTNKRQPNTCYVEADSLGKQAQEALKNIREIDTHFPFHLKNPDLACFFEQAEIHGLYQVLELVSASFDLEPSGNGPCHVMVSTLNQFIRDVRQEVNSDEFKRQKTNYKRASNKNYISMMNYSNGLFNKDAKLLIIRLDVGFKKHSGWPGLMPSTVSYEDVREYREQFIDQLSKSGLSEHLLGYGWKLEYALLKGFHYHLILFFNGSQVRQDALLGKMIGELWVEVTGQKGLYFNCNRHAHKLTYKACGIGMISHDNEEGREGLRKAILYLAKADDYIKLARQGNDRVFGKGQLPKVRSNRGRPRKNAIPNTVAEAAQF